MKSRRAFFYVQHLLGIGHLRRTLTFAKALAAKEIEVTLASGGFPVAGLELDDVRFVQLPPAAAADLTFKVLVGADERPVTEEWKSRRRDILLDAWRTADPHALILELYPFGRRQMRFELIPLLDAAFGTARRPLIASSVRDILGGGQKDAARQVEMLEVFNRYFDRVMVHGDPSVIPFAQTFRHAEAIGEKLQYTGYIVDRSGSRSMAAGIRETGSGAEVIVSAGGGAVGMRLLETAIRARAHTVLAQAPWRILCGVNAPASDLEGLRGLARETGTDRVIVERARADFDKLLANCAVSISQGGYNTVMDILQAEARAVVVPFSGGGETEQTVRAKAFADRRLIETIPEEGLSPGSLAAAVDRAATRSRPPRGTVDLGGAHRSAALLAGWMADVPW